MANMKNNKMTPGDWCFKGEETSKASETVRDAKGNWLCDCTVGNGKPISALPDLIEALNALANAANPRPGCYTTCVDKEVEQARAALKKAGVL